MTNYYTEFNLDPNASCETLCAQLLQAKKKWINRQNANSVEKRQEAERKVVLIEEASKAFADEASKTAYDRALAQASQNAGGAPQQQAQARPQQQQQPTQPQQQQGWTVERVVDTAAQNQMSGRFSANIELCRQAIAHGMEDPNIYTYLAIAYSEIGNIQNALVTMETGLKKFPDEWSLYFNICSMYLHNTNQYGVVRKYLDKLKAWDIERDAVLGMELEYLLFSGQVDAAEANIQAHLRENPSDNEYKEGAAKAYQLYANKFMAKAANGKTYYPTQEAYDSALYYRKKAHELYPSDTTQQLLNEMAEAGKRKMDRETKIAIIGLVVIGLCILPLGLLFWIAAAALAYFTYIPAWQTESVELSGNQNAINAKGIAHVLYKIGSVVARFQRWVLRTLLDIFFHS